MNISERVKLEKQNLRVKRISHTKAKGRVLGFQSISVSGNNRDSFGWNVSKASSYREALNKSLKKASNSISKILLNKKESTFLSDAVIKFGSYKILFKRRRAGSGLIASPLLTKIMNMAGIKNGLVKIYGRPDLILLIKKINSFLLEGD